MMNITCGYYACILYYIYPSMHTIQLNLCVCMCVCPSIHILYVFFPKHGLVTQIFREECEQWLCVRFPILMSFCIVFIYLLLLVVVVVVVE